MLPPTSAGNPLARNDLAGQGRGRGLAVRSGDGHDWPGQELRGEFDFADHGFAKSARLHQRRRVHGNARTDHDQVLSAKRALAVASGFDGDAVIEQHGNFIAQFVSALGVGDGDARAMRLQEQSRGHPGLAEADHEHAFVVQFHHSLVSQKW